MEEDFVGTVIRNNKAEALVLEYFLDCAVHPSLRSRLLGPAVELRLTTPYVKETTGPDFCVLKAVTLKEIERIFAITDELGISREALVIPLRTAHPGGLKVLRDGKLEIVVERDAEFDQWLSGLEAQIRSAMDLTPEEEA